MDRSMILEFVGGGRIAVKRPDKRGIPDSFDGYVSSEVDTVELSRVRGLMRRRNGTSLLLY
jgi:hypothetical protein